MFDNVCGGYRAKTGMLPVPFQVPQPFTVVPHVTVGPSGKISIVVLSSTVVGVCYTNIDASKLDGETLQKLIQDGVWATVLRSQDNAYFVPPVGLLPSPDGSSIVPPDMEAVHMAIEIGLATWPEWGKDLRSHFSPRETTPIGFPTNAIEA